MRKQKLFKRRYSPAMASTKCVFGAPAMFTEKTSWSCFWLQSKHNYLFVDPLSFAFKPQDKQKQLLAAFCVELQTL
jgi:hypothetical protein